MTDIPISRTGIRTIATAAGAVGERIKVIDVSEKPVQANVVREGKLVPAVSTDVTRLKNWLDLGVILPAEALTRVVSQSIPPGTRVARGVAVDVLLAEPFIIPLDVFERPHRGLLDRGFTVQQVVDQFLEDAEIRNAVLDFDSPDKLPPASQERIRAAFNSSGFPIEDGDPGRDFGAAFRTLQSAAAFR